MDAMWTATEHALIGLLAVNLAMVALWAAQRVTRKIGRAHV